MVPVNGTVGDPQVVICAVAATSGVDYSSVTSLWTGPNGVIVNDDRVTINATVDNDVYITILYFDYLYESDEGIYTCNVTTNSHTVSLDANLNNLTSKFSIVVTKHQSNDYIM